MNLENLLLTQVAAQIRDGRISPVEYLNALYKRIERIEPQVLAWVTLNRDAALAEAKRCETEVRQKTFRGPLHGVPIGVKDIFHTKGLRTTAGSRLFEAFVPDKDARVVEQLKNAGAIVMGKCVTTEFATFDPGLTRNPWNRAHTPGGSSSGSAAAVAAEMCPVSIGSQTVASINRPAAFCGVVGLMPTQSRVSRTGAFSVAWSLDHVGPFGRSVLDVETILSAMVDSPLQETSKPKQIRIGVIREFFYTRSTEEARTYTDAVLRKFETAEMPVSEVRLPSIFEMGHPALMTIMRSEVASAHEGLHAENAELYGRKLRSLVETGMLLDSVAYLRALRIRRLYQSGMLECFRNVSVIVTPGALGTAPEGLAYTGDPVLSGVWAVADFPTLTLPIAVAPNGLPLAIQVTAPPLQEPLLLEIAKALEEVIEFKSKPQISG